ncbi:BMP family ABC transporter substrate-binding protein [Peptoanaerobacter stomatis]|uniref:BMP family ABC transporter substrate-binding protein n=1 Tax=Peptoanaerobacter stomatis TaxID=796937 RepID=UPI003F9F5CCF
MKKIFSIFAVMMCALFLMVGCGASNDKTSDTKTSDGSEPIKVGFLYIGHINDGGFTQAHDKGRLALEENLKGKVETLYQEGVAENTQDVKNSAKIMIDQGASVIFATSFGFMDAIEELSKEYPDVKFIHFSGYKMNDTNFGNYFGAMEEPRYLSGIVAGLKTKSNKIGFVGAFPLPELFISINSFTLGVKSVNPDATVQVVWTNSWYDPAKEKEAADALLAAGCDVLAQHCDTTGPQVAAEEKNAFAIGYNSDSYDSAPKAFMTAPIWNHGVFYTKTVEEILNGTWKPESYYGNIADGYVDLLPLTENAPEEAKAKVDEIKAKMVSGDFKVFTGPIKNQAGEVVVEEGKSLNREEIWKIDYLVDGVIGTTK